jgi:hypothetical protein
MPFLKLLQGIGDKLGILESVSSAESVPVARIQTRAVSLRELTTEIRSAEVKALADSRSELSIQFEEIFTAAGISGNAEDWTIEKLGQVIASESGKEKSREAVQKSVLDFLYAKGVSTEILIKDAIARDQALDAFEARVSEKIRQRNEECGLKISEMEARIDSLRSEMARLHENLNTDNEKWRVWKRKKRFLEREMASAAGYIVDHPVVTTDEEDP